MDQANLIKTWQEEDGILQGAIFDKLNFEAVNTKLPAILVTPICDLAQNKADYVSLCAIIPAQIPLEEALKDQAGIELKAVNKEISKKGKEKVLKQLDKLIQNQFPRFFWLGEIPTLDGRWIVDLQLVKCLPLKTQEGLKGIDEMTPIAQIESPLIESLGYSYARFMGRIGLPYEKGDYKEMSEDLFNFLCN